MAHFVAWNINGGELKSLSRKGLDFVMDPRIDKTYQVGNALYSGNKLDKGHIARRADLCWGTAAEAGKANKDSFFYTNITPQHEAFNQSEKHGLWGMLENAIFEDVKVEDLKISVFGGPIFKDKDQEYRGLKIPSNFWKVIVYVDNEDKKSKAKAYILSQDDLLNDIEALELDPFKLWQVSIGEIENRVGISFGKLKKIDAFTPVQKPEGIKAGAVAKAREINSREDLVA